MASQNPSGDPSLAPSGRPPYGMQPSYPGVPPARSSPAPPIGSLPASMQNLNIGRPPPQPRAAQGPRPGMPSFPRGFPPSSLNAPDHPPQTSGLQGIRPSGPAANAIPPARGPPLPPQAGGPALGIMPTATGGPPGPPPGMRPAGSPFAGAPPFAQSSITGRPSISPFSQGQIPPSRPPGMGISSEGQSRDSPVQTATQVPNQVSGNLPNGPAPFYPGPSYSQGVNAMQPAGFSRPPVMSQGGPSSYLQMGSSQPAGPPPQFQSAIASGQGAVGVVAPPPTSLASASLPGPPTWQPGPPPVSYRPPFGGGPPGPPPSSLYGLSTQVVPPMPPPPMGQYPGGERFTGGVPGIPQPSSPASLPPTAGTSRIDPNQIPRPQTSDASGFYETRMNNQATLPPSATTNFIVRDTGNCSPRYMRCTLNQIPCSGDLLSTSGMPLALMVQPLALPHPSEDPIQVVDFGESGPVRCSRCKAYINPFMKFIDQGRRFICSLCGFTNETPRDYHCNLGPDGRRRDAEERPELCKGTVEFVANKDYMVRPPMPAVFFFLIDVSMNAVTTGATAAACSAIRRALEDLPESPQTKVGIATFDTTLHFYDLNRALQQPSMLVVPDVQDVYTPLQTGLIVSISECRQHLEQLLDSIPSMFQNTRIPDSAFGAAIKGAFLALKPTGGKLLVFQSALPTVGLGALSAREAEGKSASTAGEKEANKLFQPADKTLKTLAIDFAEFQVCVDLFLTTQGYVDIASLAAVPRTTGGQVYHYHPFSASADSAKLYNDLRWNLTRPQGLEAVMRVRCSQGVQVQDYSGNFCKRIPTDVDLPAIDCDKTIMVTFKQDDKFQDGSECCFQCALLYTTMFGLRRIRVSTLSLPCTTVLSNVFRGADLDALFTYFLKQAAQEVSTIPLVQVREQVTNLCVNILYTYRKFCAMASSSGQLILPEALKLLPLYTLALTKSIGLRSDVRVDDRSYYLTRASSLSASLAIPSVYPRMFAIHDLTLKDIGDGGLPPVLPLSSESLNNEGIFLLETGEDAFIYTGKTASPDTLQELFGVRSVNEMASTQFLLQEYENDASRKLNAMINEIRRQRCSYLRLLWCKRGDPLEFIFFSLMMEDKNSLGPSYVEFLVHIHRQIQNKMT